MKAIVMISMLMLTGCGLFGGSHEPNWPAIRNQANAWRISVNGMAESVGDASPFIAALCGARGELAVECVYARRAFDGARLGIDAAHKAIDLYQATGVAEEDVERAVSAANHAVHVVEEALPTLREVVHGLAREVDRPGSDGLRPTAQPTTAPAAEAAAAPGAGEGQTPGDSGAGSGEAGGRVP